MAQYKIRPWAPGDEAELRGMIGAFLKAGLARGGDLLPTERTIEYLLKLGMDFAAAGQPTLVAVNDHLLGYIQWGWTELPVDQICRTCQTLGSYVLPEERHNGVARALRFRGLDICREQGIERIVGPMHLTNPRGIREMLEQGAWPIAFQMERLI